MRKVTIEDISRETGLSRGTVSRALNDRPDISAATKKVVVEACKKLNYVPSHTARSLATGRNLALAVVVHAMDCFAVALLRGVLAAAEEARYSVTLIELPIEPEAREHRIRSLSAERIDGVIVACPLDPPHAALLAETVEERGLAGAVRLDGCTCDLFLPDDAEAGRLAARTLARASRKLAYIRRAGDARAEQRWTAFRDAARELGAEAAELAVATGAECSGAIASHPDAAFAASDDRLALAAAVSLAQAGRSVGSGAALLGWGNEPFAADLPTPLSTIDPGGVECGSRAAKALLSRLVKDRLDAPQVTLVAPTLIERSSTRSL